MASALVTRQDDLDQAKALQSVNQEHSQRLSFAWNKCAEVKLALRHLLIKGESNL